MLVIDAVHERRAVGQFQPLHSLDLSGWSAQWAEADKLLDAHDRASRTIGCFTFKAFNLFFHGSPSFVDSQSHRPSPNSGWERPAFLRLRDERYESGRHDCSSYVRAKSTPTFEMEVRVPEGRAASNIPSDRQELRITTEEMRRAVLREWPAWARAKDLPDVPPARDAMGFLLSSAARTTTLAVLQGAWGQVASCSRLAVECRLSR